MLSWIALGCIAGALILLAALALIDLETRLLPNELVLGLAILGLVFHLTTLGRFMPIQDIVLGGAAGFGSLFLLRMIANYFYDTDTLGLGDVKLMGAAGLWLGPETVMVAMALGAIVSLFHGFIAAVMEARKNKGGLNLSALSLPAGPGFACGIVMAGFWMFQDFRPDLFWEGRP